ncbi:MAG TPA: DUF4115 domain-containing protein [Gammaproteobacteria bacterium]|nr:DUF4115 domain-containing protein [Gammaproteobacteria bacterium]
MHTANDLVPSAARVAQGPGAMLRQAREALGLEREALAQRLRLEPRIIEAVEDEAWERLAGPAFTKGYIRSMAKELGVDPAAVLAQYTALANVAEPALADFESRAPAQITSSSKRIQFISYAIGAAVLLLVAVWWQRHYSSQVAPPPTDDPRAGATAAVPAEPSIPLPYTWTIVEHAGGPLEEPQTWRRQTDGSAPPPIDEVLPANAPAAASAADATAETPAAPASPAPSGELVLVAKRDSWVEITDLNRSRLHFGLIKGGDRIAVTGKPPYDLVIGNAPAVSLTFRGKAVDVNAHAVNGVARMAVGEP